MSPRGPASVQESRQLRAVRSPSSPLGVPAPPGPLFRVSASWARRFRTHPRRASPAAGLWAAPEGALSARRESLEWVGVGGSACERVCVFVRVCADAHSSEISAEFYSVPAAQRQPETSSSGPLPIWADPLTSTSCTEPHPYSLLPSADAAPTTCHALLVTAPAVERTGPVIRMPQIADRDASLRL